MFNSRLSRLISVISLLCVVLSVSVAPAFGQRGRRPGGQQEQEAEADTSKAKFKEYDEVITEEAISDDGVFKTHMVGEKLYYEIPRKEIGRLFLWVTQIAKNATGRGWGGQSVGNKVVRWDRRRDKILLRDVNLGVVADEEKAIYNAVEAATLPAVIMAFDIETFGEDSAMVIDVTSLFTTDVSEFSARRQLNAGSLDSKRTFIERVVSFPENIETKALLTFNPGTPQTPAEGQGRGRFGRGGPPPGTISVIMHYSMRHLPEVPMKPRYYDNRVGYITHSQDDYGVDSHQAETKRYIARWRLEKKDPNAELSEPIKPIVYWIDRSVPEKWKPYMKQGVEDWQVAFEQAGFKNAIIGKYAPSVEEDPDWSTEDARIASISWLPSQSQNAFGPHISDPRSGETLDGDIKFYHNVMRLVWSWYFVQVGPLDPRAQKLPIPDDLMGELLRYVTAHEVGHSIGFQHNMKASSSYTVKQLRDKDFTNKYGNEASIMDYGRFNYVAQPGDNARLIPMIGPYDKFAVEWGYKPIPEAKTPEDELPILNKWASRQSDDPMLRWSSAYSHDPSASTEDLGSDAVEATTYGLMNIKRVIPMIIPAIRKEGDDYSELNTLYNTVIGQLGRELGHVVNVVGGVITTEYHFGQKGEGANYVPIPRSKQREALLFLNENAFKTPTYLLDNDILNKIEPSGSVDRILQAQNRILNAVLSEERAKRMIDIAAKAENSDDVYTLGEMLEDLRGGIWSELVDGESEIDPYRRNLQRSYIRALANKLKGENASTSDMRPLARGELQEISRLIDWGKDRIRDRTSLLHLEDIKVMIEQALKID